MAHHTAAVAMTDFTPLNYDSSSYMGSAPQCSGHRRVSEIRHRNVGNTLQ